MRTKRETFNLAVVNTLCAAMWWFVALRDGAEEMKLICSVLWSVIALVWWWRYYKVSKKG